MRCSGRARMFHPALTADVMAFESLMPELIALGQVLFIDIVLAGDNAIVVGMAAAGLPLEQRRKAIMWGIAAATILRIFFAAITTQLMSIVGLVLAGGVLLLWVCWKMFRELQAGHKLEEEAGVAALDEDIPDHENAEAGGHPDPARRRVHESG